MPAAHWKRRSNQRRRASVPKVFIMAEVPPEKAKAFLQHVRDFDAANPDCRFEIAIDAPESSLAEAIRMMQSEPPLHSIDIPARRKPTWQ